jgi:Mn-dependent DtxR family transcriptional regulator
MNETERRTLVDLIENGDNIPKNIANNVDRHVGSIRRAVAKLEEKGLIKNKGGGVYTLTERGREATSSLVKFVEKAEQ